MTNTNTNDYVAAYGRPPATISLDYSDEEYYGRKPALGLDMAAVRRGAVIEAGCGWNKIVMGEVTLGTLLVRRAVVRLSIALGNETVAMEYLTGPSMTPSIAERYIDAPENVAARAAIDAAVARPFPLPRLASELAALDEQIATERRVVWRS